MEFSALSDVHPMIVKYSIDRPIISEKTLIVRGSAGAAGTSNSPYLLAALRPRQAVITLDC